MKNKRALTLLLAAAMLMPQFAVMASAKSDHNFVNIEEEVLVENGTFDEAPEIKIDQGRAYHTQAPGTWSYQYNTTGTADVKYAKDGDNGYLKITAANVNPSVAYTFGEVKKGDYKLSLDVYPESDSNVNRMIVQVFYNLDSGFGVGNTAYRLITKEFGLTKGAYNTLTLDVSLAEDTKLAFRVYSQPDNPANGSFRIDNLSLGRPADILIDTADLDAVDTSKAYTGAADATLPAGRWVADDSTYLKLDNSGSYIAAKKNDTLIPETPAVIYTFPKALDAGKYRLTVDVLTNEPGNGHLQIANVTSNWAAIKWYDINNGDSITSITGGKRYTVIFNVANDNTLVGFRYYQKDNVIPSQPFAIDNLKLEKAGTVYEIDFDGNEVITIVENGWNNKNNAVPYRFSRNHSNKDQAKVFKVDTVERDGNANNKAFHYQAKTKAETGESGEATPAFAIGIGNLLRGKYTVIFDYKIVNGNGFARSVQRYYAGGSASITPGWSTSGPVDGWYTATLTFDVTNDDKDAYLFRIWPGGDGAEFYVDNIKVVASEAYEMKTIASDDFSDAAKSKVTVKAWGGVSVGEWASASGGSDVLEYLKVEDGALKYKATANTPSLGYGIGNLAAGSYEIGFDIIGNGAVTRKVHVVKNGSRTDVSGYTWTTSAAGSATRHKINFDVTSDYNNCFHLFRFYGPAATSFSVDNFEFKGTALTEWFGWLVYDSETAAAPQVKTDAGINFNNSKNYKDTWCIRENNNAIAAVKMTYADGKLNIAANETAIHAKPTVMYRFNNTLAKGNYSVDVTLKNLADIGNGDKYTVSLRDTAGNLITAIEQTVAKDTSVNIPLSFTLDSDADVVLCIKSTYTDAKFTSAYEVREVTLTKLSNPLIQLRSNADLATFESDDGVYYMAVNAENDIYINYFSDKEFRPGCYKLTAELRTDAPDGAELKAYFAQLPLDTYALAAGDEWQEVEYDVTLKYSTKLSATRGIRFDVDSINPLYLRNLKLVYVDDLPQPALNSAIVMILLKKIQGTYPGHIINRPIEYAVNGGFDKEVQIDHDQSRAYLKHADGRWTYSKNSGDVTAYVHKDGYAYFEVANANPAVGHRVGTLPAGSYTLSFEITPEYNIGSIRTRVFRLADGFAVGKTEYVLVDSMSPISVGKSNTVTCNFVLTAETVVAFNFYASKENPCPEKGNFRLDNVSVLKQP